MYTQFGIFNLMFQLIFIMAFVMVFLNIVKSIRQWNKNNHSPRLTVEAAIATKRTYVSRRRSSTGHHHTSTRYYVTFEVESGDRMELQVEGMEYGLLAEGDKGKLTFQGTRYLEFECI